MCNRLKEILKEQNKTQFWLSQKTGIIYPDLNQVVNCKKFCHPGWRKKIAKALNMKEAEIFQEVSKKVGA